MKNTDLLIEIFCDIDDFCKEFEPQWRKKLLGGKRNRLGHLTLSEIMTIAIFFHLMRFRTFKDYYTLYASSELRIFFPNLLSYTNRSK